MRRLHASLPACLLVFLPASLHVRGERETPSRLYLLPTGTAVVPRWYYGGGSGGGSVPLPSSAPAEVMQLCTVTDRHGQARENTIGMASPCAPPTEAQRSDEYSTREYPPLTESRRSRMFKDVDPGCGVAEGFVDP
ncbi:hypothetical protein BZA05DRAFT_433786 [Tricharina praecox]|uniref:uncharacterized protein n=1 Tax=Tricharina praecox TaxID=43433 RepID=UPI002220150E|nr:uncharacterized protein BZA05DRAFT_433786 [Tricharina praecox]KAI5857157.1 hypothetical protein BZA05DRAFT_433786 [Tricharina praecox]